MFGIVNNLCIQNDIAYAKVFHLKTVVFDEHFYAYEVIQPEEKQYELVKLSVLPECEPLSLLRNFPNDDNYYICPKTWL